MAHPFSPHPPLSGPATKKRTFFAASLTSPKLSPVQNPFQQEFEGKVLELFWKLALNLINLIFENLHAPFICSFIFEPTILSERFTSQVPCNEDWREKDIRLKH